MLYGDDIYSVSFTYCVFCALLVFTKIVVIYRLEAFATELRVRDAAISDRVLALAMLFWMAGFNVGSIFAGFPEDADQQRLFCIIGPILPFHIRYGYSVPTAVHDVVVYSHRRWCGPHYHQHQRPGRLHPVQVGFRDRETCVRTTNRI